MSSPVRVRAPISRPVSVRQPLRLVPHRPVVAPRTPFVLLVLCLLGAGLVALLLLNAAAVANSSHQRALRRQIDAAQIHEQQLRRSVTAKEAPGALAAEARRLGMVPSGDPVFLVVSPDGSAKVIGSPSPAPSPSPSPSSSTSAQQPGSGRPDTAGTGR